MFIGTFSEVLDVSTSAEAAPCELLKKLDQNFSTFNSPITPQKLLNQWICGTLFYPV